MMHDPTLVYGMMHDPTLVYGMMHDPTSVYGMMHDPTSAYGMMHDPTLVYGMMHDPTSVYGMMHDPTLVYGMMHDPTLVYGMMHDPTLVYGMMHDPTLVYFAEDSSAICFLHHPHRISWSGAGHWSRQAWRTLQQILRSRGHSARHWRPADLKMVAPVLSWSSLFVKRHWIKPSTLYGIANKQNMQKKVMLSPSTHKKKNTSYSKTSVKPRQKKKKKKIVKVQKHLTFGRSRSIVILCSLLLFFFLLCCFFLGPTSH